MAYAYRQSTSQGNASGGALTVTKPTGTADGDLIVVVAYLETDTNVWDSVGAGFAAVAQIPTVVGEFSVQMWWKWASSEPGTWTWTPHTTAWRAVCAASYSGGSGSGTATDVSGKGSGAAQSAPNQTAPSVTTTVDHDLLIWGYGNFGGGIPTSMAGKASNLRVTLGGCTIADFLDISPAAATGTSSPIGPGTEDYAAIHSAFFLSPAVAAAFVNIRPQAWGSVPRRPNPAPWNHKQSQPVRRDRNTARGVAGHLNSGVAPRRRLG